jgi:RNA polymerase sigma-70 factor (ECF subfamily)
MSPSLEKLFARYRERGDAGALAEVFDRTAPELLRLAAHLVRDPLAAEDVLQDTFVAAIDAAPRWDAERPLVPWLTGILARKASESRRRARREVDPARLGERGERDPAHLAEDSEFSRELRAALAGLPELYRVVLERHLLDGARPAEIARDLARSPGAVRMQLLRGLEQLRRALPAGFAAGAALALLSPRGLAAVREAVLAHAVSQGAVLAAAGGAAAASAFAWPLALAAALVLALAGAGWLWLGVDLDAPRELAPVAPQAVETTPEPRAPEGVAPQPRTQASSVAQAPAPLRMLRGRVHGPEGEAMSSVELALRGLARHAWPEAGTLRAHPDLDGRFEIDLDALLASARVLGVLDALELTVDHPDWLPERLRLDAGAVRLAAADAREIELWVDVPLRRALVLAGQVERVIAGPAPEVGALALREGEVEPRWLDLTTADASGRFRLRLGAPGEVEVVACAADTLPDSERLWVAPGGALLPRALRLEAGVRLAGTIRAPLLEGAIEGLRLHTLADGSAPPTMRLAGRSLARRSGAWSPGAVDAAVDGSGRFLAEGLVPGALQLAPQTRAGVLTFPLSAFSPTLEIAAPDEVRELELAVARLDVRLVDAGGASVPGLFDLQVDEWPAQLATHADGTRAVFVPPSAVLRLASTSRPELAREFTAPAAGQVLAVDVHAERAPHLAPLTLEIAVPAGATAPGECSVAFSRPGEDKPFDVRPLQAQAGRLTLVDPPAQAFELELFVGGQYRHLVDGWLPARLSVPESGGRLLAMPLALERGARLRLVARDAAGRPLPLAARIFDLWGAEHAVRFLHLGNFDKGFTADGRLSELGPVDVVPNLAPGLWSVEVVGPDGVARTRHVRLAAGDEVELEFAP